MALMRWQRCESGYSPFVADWLTAPGNRHSSGGYGWERCLICVDDPTRLTSVEVQPDERARPLCLDGPCPSRRELGIRHVHTQPYRPRTNGKARQIASARRRRQRHAQNGPRDGRGRFPPRQRAWASVHGGRDGRRTRGRPRVGAARLAPASSAASGPGRPLRRLSHKTESYRN